MQQPPPPLPPIPSTSHQTIHKSTHHTTHKTTYKTSPQQINQPTQQSSQQLPPPPPPVTVAVAAPPSTSHNQHQNQMNQQSVNVQSNHQNGSAHASNSVGVYPTAMVTLSAAPNQNVNVIAAPIVVDFSNFTVNCVIDKRENLN